MAESLGALIDEVAQVNQVGTTQAADTTTDATAATTTDTTDKTDAGAATTTDTSTASAETELTEIADSAASTQAATTDTTDKTDTTTATKSFEDQLKELGYATADEAKNAKTELQQLKERNTLGTLIDKLAAQGVDPEVAIRYQKLDFTAKNADGTPKIGDRAVLDLQMQLKYPSLSAEQRAAMLDEDYGGQNPDDANYSIARQGKQTVDASKAREALMADKAKVLDVKTASESFEAIKNKEFAASETARVKEWETTPKLKEITSGLSKIAQKMSFSTFGADNKPVAKNFDFTHKIDTADAAKIEESLRVAAIQQGFDPKDPEAFKNLQGMAENIYVLQNKEKLMNDVARQVSSYFHKYIAKTYHGAKGSDMDRGGTGKNQSDARYEATMAGL